MQGSDQLAPCVPVGATVEVRPAGWMGIASGDVVLAQVGVEYAAFYQVEIRYREGRRKAELVSAKADVPPIEGVKPIEEEGETRILGVASRVVDLSLNKG